MNIEYFDHFIRNFDDDDLPRLVRDVHLHTMDAPEGYRFFGNWTGKFKYNSPDAYLYSLQRKNAFYDHSQFFYYSTCLGDNMFPEVPHYRAVIKTDKGIIYFRMGHSIEEKAGILHKEDLEDFKENGYMIPFAVPLCKEEGIRYFLPYGSSIYERADETGKQEILKNNTVLLLDRKIYEVLMRNNRLIVPFLDYLKLYDGCEIKWYDHLYRKLMKFERSVRVQTITKHEREDLKKKLVERIGYAPNGS